MITIRYPIALVVCAALTVLPALASAQGAPFTIRRPPDGATVREKVRVEIPSDSIPSGGVVAFFIDNKFVVALPPASESSKEFTYIWDTKGDDLPGQQVPDGSHAIRAVLYAPTGGGTEAMDVKAQSEVKVTVANAIKGVGPVYLRYKYKEGENMEYGRDGKSVVVSALSGLNATGDQQLSLVTSRLQLGIEDSRPDRSLVRNKLTALTIEENGQQTRVDPQQLSASMYQELDPEGNIWYEIGGASAPDQFSATGIPINNTLELPLLPPARVAPGDAWTTSFQRIDIPGMPTNLQPLVTLSNKFDGFEWDSGYPTAKIHQTFEGTVSKSILFGNIDVSSPHITYDRYIYLAYKSGLLVKVVRTMTVSGQTTAVLANAQPSAGARPGGPAGASSAAGSGPPSRPQFRSAPGGRFGHGGGGGGGSFGGGGNLPGAGGQRPGGPGFGGPGGRGPAGASITGAGGGSNTPTHPVTLKSTTITQLLHVTR